MNIASRITTLQQRVDLALTHCLAARVDRPERLLEAMRYSVLGPGKRIRPVLCYLTGEALAVDIAWLDAPACAVEMIHAYSLIHDDLPAMDDDDLRRGRATCHRAFDEATAILAGDALQVLAFEVLSGGEPLGAPVPLRLAMVRRLAAASGIDGMAGGQAMDLAAEEHELSIEELASVHRRKTGALIQACVLMIADLAEASSRQATALATYADRIGLAFQVRDDILDVEGDEAALGKRVGADVRLHKATYPALLGLEGARREASRLLDEALAALQPLGTAANGLEALARYIIERRH